MSRSLGSLSAISSKAEIRACFLLCGALVMAGIDGLVRFRLAVEAARSSLCDIDVTQPFEIGTF